MVKARRLGHIVMNVRDLEASRDFYCKALGLEVIAENGPGRIVFLSLGEQHHDLALIQRATGEPPDESQPGMIHMAWNVEDFPTLQEAYRELLANGIEPEPIQHNVTNSLYMRDPDGNLVELYCDRWGEQGMEVMRTQGPQRRSLDMETGEAVGESQELLKARV
jgi:catechol-2,3-dioxygenase